MDAEALRTLIASEKARHRRSKRRRLAGCIVIVAALFIGGSLGFRHFYPKPPPDDVAALNSQLGISAREASSVPSWIERKYSDTLSAAGARAVRLLADAKKFTTVYPGGGSRYSFQTRTYTSNKANIELNGGNLKTGFAGVDYGYFLRLGPTPLADVIKDGRESPPSWLNKSLYEAWRHMWTYEPPHEEAFARVEQREARSLRKGTVSVAEVAPVATGETYLLRSILADNSDSLIAFQVASRENNDDVVLVWKIVKVFDTPMLNRN